ncbi:MAG: hypothetical protein ABEL97_07015 [Salinibacter sp.]
MIRAPSLLRMMLRRTPAVFIVLALVPVRPAPAQQPDSAAMHAAFDSVVTAHTYTATLKNGQLTGPGADWLAARGREVDHFLMGERHGTTAIPQVAASLYERLADHGYGPVALEIGPYAAQATDRALRQGGYPALKALVTRHEAPVIPFLSWKEESKMAARMAEAGATIWGVDYEFLFSLPMHVDALADQAETSRERTAVQRIRTQMKESWGGEGGKALARAAPSALRALRAAFEPRGDEAALARIDAMLESNAIYAPYVRGTGSFPVSNRRRETLMKEQLIDHVRTWEREHGEAPKVFHKNAHVSKLAPADLHVPFGAFVAEWSRGRGQETFHVLADCNGGQIPKTGQGGGGECTAYLGGDGSPLARHLRDDAITVIDLRPLRRYFGADFLSEKLSRQIVSFDAYVAIPDVQPSEPLTPLPRGE